MSRSKLQVKQSIQPSLIPAQAIPKLQRQLDRLDAVIQMRHEDGEIEAWESTTLSVLNAAFGQPNGNLHPTTCDIQSASGGARWLGMSDQAYQAYHVKKQQKRKALLAAAIEQLKDQAEATGESVEETTSPESVLKRVKQILNRFHSVVVQLRHRYGERETVDVDDEYDVQDLLHALLRIEFDDIRREEHMPSTAGSNPRVDILLKNEQVFIEIKKTRAGLSDKKLGEELIQDIATYQAHPDCKMLICFIYDPEHRVRNAAGLSTDLARVGAPKLRVETIVNPSQ